ncbi:unnamed protein product [Paramecium sonneborni]|uniref:Uncharacterized protein n=1 Tax=Paramecium sonneborni TaxID=65129 RepID=A0A8S1MIX4_9CILI|nr:unnamed protein product [Paramecium sonneborni]
MKYLLFLHIEIKFYQNTNQNSINFSKFSLLWQHRIIQFILYLMLNKPIFLMTKCLYQVFEKFTISQSCKLYYEHLKYDTFLNSF